MISRQRTARAPHHAGSGCQRSAVRSLPHALARTAPPIPGYFAGSAFSESSVVTMPGSILAKKRMIESEVTTA